MHHYTLIESANVLNIPTWKLRYLIQTGKVPKPSPHGEHVSKNSKLYYSSKEIKMLTDLLARHPEWVKVRPYRKLH